MGSILVNCVKFPTV